MGYPKYLRVTHFNDSLGSSCTFRLVQEIHFPALSFVRPHIGQTELLPNDCPEDKYLSTTSALSSIITFYYCIVVPYYIVLNAVQRYRYNHDLLHSEHQLHHHLQTIHICHHQSSVTSLLVGLVI